MSEQEPAVIRREDYSAPDYLVDRVELRFELGDDETLVHSRLNVRRNYPANERCRPLVLNGEDMELENLALDGEDLAMDDYLLGSQSLTLPQVPESFRLDVVTRIHPERNTRLEGLYRSGGMFCTQCEAEGFRRITYFPDRPDVMARYTVTIVADRDRFPVLLSNGNLADRGEESGNRHWVRWDDPFPKPSYLFALVAGDLGCLEDRHVTASGREIALRIYTEHHNVDKTAHAMASLKAAMEWDEKTYGLECDLDDYKVVAVDHFNMGAMENKGLNIFNSQFILARPDTATDGEYQNIEAVIGHEYFHNWTGNRVTLRDWFQLSLKEGLTVFREQQFSAAMGAPAVKRINEVRILRAAQFPEDAGPMAHPVRPDEYMEINNFYTATVYMKGAEVIRMYHQLLGAEGFRRGMDLYFERHDGQAVTCDDFLAAMADANGVDLGQFGRWYSQAGTPRVRVTDEYDPETATYTLHVHQNTPPTPGQKEKFPLHMPMVTALVGPDGADMPAILENESAATAGSRALDVTEEKQSFRFTSVPQRPVPSLFRGFSAPVLLEYDYSDEQLAFLFAHDADDFNRWEAGQQLACRILLRWVKEGPGQLPEVFGHAFRQTLTDSEADMALVAEALTLPPESFVAEQMAVIDVEGIHDARESLRRQLGETLQTELRERLESLGEEGPYTPDPASIARRRLRSVLLSYLAATDSEDARQRCLAQYRQASNMTQSLAALGLLADMAWEKADSALEDFHARWKDNSLVLDKWFRVQATSQRPDTLERVRTLTGHPDFDRNNPNRVRALLGAFAQGNPARFHDASGAGYNLLTEHVMELDRINPQLAARLVTPLSRWRRYDEARGKLMKASLERIRARRGLSNDVYEIVSKSLQEAE